MRILLPRFDTHGDLILLEGFVEALRDHYPGSSVTLLVRPGYDQLAPLFPAELQWHTVTVDPYAPIAPGAGQLARIQRYLSTHEYDLVIGTCFTQTWADAAVAALANPGAQRITLCGARGPQPVPQALVALESSQRNGHRFWDRTIMVDEQIDECAKYQTLWTALSGNGQLPSPRLRIPPTLDAQGRAILRQAGLASGSYVCCCPAGTANVAIKRWPCERFAEVIAWLERVHRLPTLIVGHKNERGLLESVRVLGAARGARPSVWIGRDGQLPLLAALTRRARLYLGNDSAPMHLAAALDVPAVAIFGGGHWPRFVPRTNTVALVRELLCFNCHWQCLFGDALCVQLVRTDDVRRAVDLALAEVAPPEGESTRSQEGEPRVMDRVGRSSRIIRLHTRFEVEPISVWLEKAEARAAARMASPAPGLLHAVARRMRALGA